MIRTRMTGGLGNQLFQWACAKNLQKKYGHPIQFEDHILASSRNRDIMNFPNITWNTEEYIKNEYTSGENIPYSIYQDKFSFSDFSRIDFTKNEFFHLIGYWQGVDYFKESQEEIRESLRPNQQFIDNNKWSNGSIYDARSGKTYNLNANLKNQNTLFMRGYIGFSLIGRTTTWTRVSEN